MKTESQTLSKDIKKIMSLMATKSDLIEIRQTMATKSDLIKIKQTMATKSDLEAMATKADLKQVQDVLGYVYELSSKKNDDIEDLKQSVKVISVNMGNLTDRVDHMAKTWDDHFKSPETDD
jgi:hypothetical protein